MGKPPKVAIIAVMRELTAQANALLSRRPDTPGTPHRPTLGFHFQTDHKADWWEIDDDLPQYPGDRPG